MADKNLVTDKARGTMLWAEFTAGRPAMKKDSVRVIESRMKEKNERRIK